MEICKFSRKQWELAQKFTCGNVVIDHFLKDGNALDPNQGITYLLLSEDKDFVIGYYNIEAGRIDQIESVGGREVIVPMGGAININYLAIHTAYQHTKIAESDGQRIYFGDYLLHDCEKRILKLSREVGVSFITLYSTEQGYHMYHHRNSYENFEDDMSTFVKESDRSSYKLYKCIDDMIA